MLDREKRGERHMLRPWYYVSCCRRGACATSRSRRRPTCGRRWPSPTERDAHLSREYQADALERLANFPTGSTTPASGTLKGATQVGYSAGGSR
jgi:hypothetical protein